jgi:hypothetical protein
VGGLRIEAEPVYPAPIAEASSTFSLPGASTAADGTFRITALAAGRHVLRLSLTPDYALADMPVVEAGSKGVVIRLGAASAITLRIADGDGRPAAGAKVTAHVPGRDWAMREATADAKGVATLAGLAASGRYVLEVEPPPGRTDLAAIRIRDWSPAAATLTLPAGALVEGTVRSATGGVPRAAVWWRDSRGEWTKVSCDPMGDFRLVALAGSRVTLSASPPYTPGRDRAGPEVTVDAGAKGVLLRVGE